MAEKVLLYRPIVYFRVSKIRQLFKLANLKPTWVKHLSGAPL
jgi:hypothetical protein